MSRQASTWFDPVIGLDLHLQLVLRPPLPPFVFLFPHPFIGLVVDPIGLAVSLAISNAIGLAMGQSGLLGPVLVNSLPATTAGTNAWGLPVLHWPYMGAWVPFPRIRPPIRPGDVVKPDMPIPPNDSIIITGSDSVYAMGASMSRDGDFGLSCSDPVRLPFSFIIAIAKGNPVLVGGGTKIDFLSAAIGIASSRFITTPLRRFLGGRLRAFFGHARFHRLRNLWDDVRCFFTGHPVDVATGRVLAEAEDWRLAGPVTLRFRRRYLSSFSDRSLSLGHGWSHTFDEALWQEAGGVVYRAGDGRELELGLIDRPARPFEIGESFFEPIHRLTVQRTAKDRWEVIESGGVIRVFEQVTGAPAGHHRLVAVHHGPRLTTRLLYDPAGHLVRVVDPFGRPIRFQNDARGRVVAVELPHPDDADRWEIVARYRYSEQGDLIEVEDAEGGIARFEYASHLLVKETDRNGFSYHFGYDARGPEAYCVRTWGDAGVFDREIVYDKKRRATYVTDSLGATTTFVVNDFFLITEVADPVGDRRTFEYDDDGRVAAITHPTGHTERFRRDARGNLVQVEHVDGTSLRLEYDERDRVTRTVHRNGAETTYRYDGRAVDRVDPGGARFRTLRDDRGLVVRIDGPGGRREITRDELGRPVRISAEGTWIEHEHDRRSRVTGIRFPDGRRLNFEYDALDRVRRIADAEGELVAYRHDAEGNRVEERSAALGVTVCTFEGPRRLTSRTTAGQVTRFRYDTEGRLAEVVAPNGDVHRWERDPIGRPVMEKTFDGRVLRYQHGTSGRKVTLPSGKAITIAHDAAARTTTVRWPDGTATHLARHVDGSLAEVKGPTGALRFEQDLAGRVVAETSEQGRITRTHDELGRLTGVSASWGFRMDIDREPLGKPVMITARDAEAGAPFVVELAYDALHRMERARSLPGKLSLSWSHDVRLALPVRREVRRAGDLLSARTITWEKNRPSAALEETTGELTRFASSGTGAVDTLVGPDGNHRPRFLDAQGRPFRHKDGSDRRYGPGGRLEESDRARWEHDEDGLPRRKVLPDGRTYTYDFDGAGRLAGVTRPDGRVVRFGYDPLGRRLWKETCGRTTRWTWVGSQPVSETAEDRAPVSWVFHPNGWELLGMIRDGAPFAAVTGLFGEPETLHDARGEEVWRADLDLWGNTGPGSTGENCPWRFPGQYADEETGLHHNGLRYYDPETGRYLTPDPLGLAGGMDPYGYVEDPLTHADPLGLVGCYRNPVDAAHALRTIREGDLLFGYSDDVYRFLDELEGLGRLNAAGELIQPKVLRQPDIIQYLIQNPWLAHQLGDPNSFATWADAVMLFEAQQIDDVLSRGGRVFFLWNPAERYDEVIKAGAGGPSLWSPKGHAMIFTAWESFFLNDPALDRFVVNVDYP